MEFSEIATELGISESAVRDVLSRGLRRIERAGDMDTFTAVVRLTQFRKAEELPIPCGSIECRPEKWIFY